MWHAYFYENLYKQFRYYHKTVCTRKYSYIIFGPWELLLDGVKIFPHYGETLELLPDSMDIFLYCRRDPGNYSHNDPEAKYHIDMRLLMLGIWHSVKLYRIFRFFTNSVVFLCLSIRCKSFMTFAY